MVVSERLRLKARLVPFKVRPATPFKDTDVALACKLVHRRLGLVVEAIKAKPNSTPLRLMAMPLLSPKRAEAPVAPKVITLVCTPTVVSFSAVPEVSAASLTVTGEVLWWKAKFPLRRKKSPATTLAPVSATSCKPADKLPKV